ncbi:MAG: hypothetical protein ACI81R_000869 [Bradymonadia bacterium]|jgi:hypothetical protein
MSIAAETLRRVYGVASMPRICGGKPSDPEKAYTELEKRFGDKPTRKKIIEDLDEPSIWLLSFMEDIGRRLRGERLKKRWFLHGYDDFEESIMPLVEAGVVIVGNLSAREPVSLETALEQGLLQQWLQLTPSFEKFAGSPPPAREVVQQVVDETVVQLERRTLVVEFNLLNVVRYVERDTIRLNRDGSPHRSDLKGLAPLLIDRPGTLDKAEAAPDPLEVHGWDVIIFLLSIAGSLGMIERNGDILRATDNTTSYFKKSLVERIPLLARAMEHQRAYSELDAAQWFSEGEPPMTGQGDGGFLEEGGHGLPLAGPRASVYAAIRRLSPNDWFDVDDTVNTITGLERQYLQSALPIPAGDEHSAFTFVRGVITIGLPHVGAMMIGRGSDDKLRAKLTPIGRAMLSMADCPEEPSGEGAIIVEPNFEITAFLDAASLSLLNDMSRFAELTQTSERVVRYHLDGEYAQWGYARGYTADGIQGILATFSSQPIPPAVTFALQDWERLHRRVTVFVHGDVVGSGDSSDPEIVQSGVEFVVNSQDDIERIDAIHTYCVAGHVAALEHALTAHKPMVINYDGPIVATLHWVDDERIRAPLGATDFRLISRLRRVCEQENEEVYRILPAKVKSVWGDDTGFEMLVETLREGVVGGLVAEREISLQRLLGAPIAGSLHEITVLRVPTPAEGDRIAGISGLDQFVTERLGPTAFEVRASAVSKLVTALSDLGIDVTPVGK